MDYRKDSLLTSIYIFTNINNSWSFTNPSPGYMKYSVKYIWVTIVHADSARFFSTNNTKKSIKYDNLFW
jgi:hypothetical protein